MTTTNVAVSNRDKRHKPPQETNQPPMSSPSSFTSLPRDLVLNILVRLPKRLYPILCCVSKNLRSLVLSDEIQETRSSLGKDSLYVCVKDGTIDEENIFTYTYHCHWFNLRRVEKSNTENVFVSVDFSFLPEHCRRSTSVVAYGPEMFFIPGTNHYSTSFRIFDTQSGNLCVPMTKRVAYGSPILCCVSKNLRSLVLSDEIQETRSSLGKDSLYVCVKDGTIDEENIFTYTYHCHWFNLRRVEKSNTENVFVSVDFSFLPEHCRRSTSVVAYGPEMFFIPGTNHYSTSFRIFDTQSGNVRQGPSLLAYRTYNCVALVGGKIYVIGGCIEGDPIAESFNLKTEAWEPALCPHDEESRIWIHGIGAPLDRKVCAVSLVQGLTCYDTRDGSCESSELPFGIWWKSGVCVIDNVLYVYFSSYGLMWYDTELRLWRVVYDLDLGKPQGVAMAEYYGKLAFLWEKPSLLFRGSKEIWCRMIGLARSEEGFNGAAEPSQLLRIVPRTFSFHHCLSVG
ncbi:PREDICTED: F-box/kelch-repeat protein At2g44700-like [Camelina sativa]|uniref:F-box/kelch-repeat protein At2g44700-like n=1 Tax=Camelina sativa TaxID=90675 RepID=A0ABM1RSJ2_CAMSA|nr:PREDICTED: F-box/kelch-repeat protein At2g44700-like [Camelina sativa]